MSPLEFTSLDVPAEVLAGIRDAGFATATPIQEAALPLALKGRDVAGQSQTGTGKTAAFLIAAFARCLAHPAPARRRSNRSASASSIIAGRPMQCMSQNPTTARDARMRSPLRTLLFSPEAMP